MLGPILDRIALEFLTMTTTNDLTAAFTAATSTLGTAATALDLLAGRLSAVATKAEAERQRVASLLASLPAIPAEVASGAFAEALGLDVALDELVAARQHLGNHSDALNILGAVAAGQADRVQEVRLELLAVAGPPVGPCVICGEPAPRDSLGVHACDVCAPLAPAAVPASQDGPGQAIAPEVTPEPSKPVNACQTASQGRETAPYTTDNGAVMMPAEDLPAVCANPPAEPAPVSPLSPVAEDAAAPELTEAQKEALATAILFFAAAEPGRRYDAKEILPECGYQGRDARRALRKIPTEALAAARIATDGNGAFWRT